ncbi:MAG: branched-chain amino acid ABC transporter substrate-binding protein [Rhizobiales bacterium PAR1]|nr:MAG: branched-chain amino acid ABC transporter substrate-binding protein [Rhizobiales bacterium PAR1]
MRRHLARAVLAAASITATALAVSAQDIKVGFNGDVSASPSALSGQAGVIGIQAAIDDINAAGGLLGRKVVLVVRDDLSQPPKSIQNMSDLIDNEKVAAVFGPTNSGNALAWKHIANQKQVPVLGMIGSATDITKAAPGVPNYMFRVSMVDRSQVAGLMAYVKAGGAGKKVGYMAETTGYGQGGLKDIQEIGALHGIKPEAVEAFAVGDTDMTSQLNKMKAAGVDTLVIWGQGTPLGHILRSMEKINYFPTYLTSWAADNKSFFDAAGPQLAEKPLFMRTITDSRTPKQQQLYDRVSAKLPTPSAFGFLAHGYDSMMLLGAAIKQAKSTEGPKVKAALEALEGKHEGFMKTYEKPFSAENREGLGAADYKWTRWKDGKLVIAEDGVISSLKLSDFKM